MNEPKCMMLRCRNRHDCSHFMRASSKVAQMFHSPAPSECDRFREIGRNETLFASTEEADAFAIVMLGLPCVGDAFYASALEGVCDGDTERMKRVDDLVRKEVKCTRENCPR